MTYYLHFIMSGFAILMVVVGLVQIFSHQDGKSPTFLPVDPSVQTQDFMKFNSLMLRAVGDQVVGAIFIFGGFISGCLLWF